MITEDYVNRELSFLLSLKGFDEPTLYHYIGENKMSNHTIDYALLKNSETDNCRSAPTLQMAMKWLREVHKLAINVEFQIDCHTWKWRIYRIEPLKGKYTNFKHYNTYEEACIAAIKYALENLI